MNWSLFSGYFLASALQIKFRLLALLIAVVVLATCYVMYETPQYKTSWVVLLPGKVRASTINLDNLGEARSNGGNAYGSVSISPKNTYKEIALSDAVIHRAARELGISALAFNKPRITLIDQTPAMRFSLKGEAQDELKRRAELYNHTFHAILDELRSNEIERNFAGVENNLAEAKQRLTDARQAIVRYQSQSNIVSDQQFQRWLSDAEALRTEQTHAEVKLAELDATLTVRLDQLGITAEQANALALLQANPATTATLSLLGEKLAEQTKLEASYAAANPLRKKIDREVISLTKALKRKLAYIPQATRIPDTMLYGLLSNKVRETIESANTLLADISGARAQVKAIQTNYQHYAERIKIHAQDAATLTDLQREHQIAEAIFSSALAKLDTSRLDIYATYPLTQLLTQPGATIERDRLQAKLMVIAVFAIYGLLALSMVLTRIRKRVSKELRTNKRSPLERGDSLDSSSFVISSSYTT